MHRSFIAGFVLSAVSVCAQLIPDGKAVPRTTKPPVIFLNGYESDCGNASFKHTFGIADQALQANGQVSLFFNYCTVPGQPSIEDMGAALGAFLAGLRYEDGQPVDLVDSVAHSMGGLIVRSYLSGKRSAAGVFNPPAVTHFRKIVFLATPHFGTGVNAGLPFSNAQLDELTSGSRFLFDLATWNQGTDDLRGVDAIAVIGNGGTGNATTDGFDDGVIALTSASLGFYLPGRTRVVPFCHVDGGGIISFAGYCGFNSLGIAVFRSTTQDPARIVISFLNGTTDWRTIGVGAERQRCQSSDRLCQRRFRIGKNEDIESSLQRCGLHGDVSRRTARVYRGSRLCSCDPAPHLTGRNRGPRRHQNRPIDPARVPRRQQRLSAEHRAGDDRRDLRQPAGGRDRGGNRDPASVPIE